VCAWHAQHSPKLVDETERMARLIVRHVDDWEDMAAHLALLASMLASPAEAAKVRLEIGRRNLATA
jgi:hypothetical protein